MNRSETVKQLRAMATERKGEVMELPIEFVNILNSSQVEDRWSYIGVEKALSYFADMLEE